MSRADARALEELNTAIALSSSMADKPQPKPKTPPDPKQVAIVSAFHQFLEGEVRVAKKESVKDEQARKAQLLNPYAQSANPAKAEAQAGLRRTSVDVERAKARLEAMKKPKPTDGPAGPSTVNATAIAQVKAKLKHVEPTVK